MCTFFTVYKQINLSQNLKIKKNSPMATIERYAYGTIFPSPTLTIFLQTKKINLTSSAQRSKNPRNPQVPKSYTGTQTKRTLTRKMSSKSSNLPRTLLYPRKETESPSNPMKSKSTLLNPLNSQPSKNLYKIN